MKFYVPLVYDREDNMGTVYFQEGSKLYTEEEKKALEQKGVKKSGKKSNAMRKN